MSAVHLPGLRVKVRRLQNGCHGVIASTKLNACLTSNALYMHQVPSLPTVARMRRRNAVIFNQKSKLGGAARIHGAADMRMPYQMLPNG